MWVVLFWCENLLFPISSDPGKCQMVTQVIHILTLLKWKGTLFLLNSPYVAVIDKIENNRNLIYYQILTKNQNICLCPVLSILMCMIQIITFGIVLAF